MWVNGKRDWDVRSEFVVVLKIFGYDLYFVWFKNVLINKGFDDLLYKEKREIIVWLKMLYDGKLIEKWNI